MHQIIKSSNGRRSWRLLACLSVGLLFALQACGGDKEPDSIGDLASATQGAASEPAEYTLGPGDKVRLTVFGQPNMSGEFTVSGAGSVSLPFIGKVRTGGLTVGELENSVADKLTPDYLKNPRVSVEVLNFRPFHILGEVKKPGSYPYVNGMTVTIAVAVAGGYTYRAREESFYVIRATDASQTEKAAGADTVVLPGDIIKVRERIF